MSMKLKKRELNDYFKKNLWRLLGVAALVPAIFLVLSACAGPASSPAPPGHLSESEAGRVVLKAIEAHGGWAAWMRARTAEYIMEQPSEEEGKPPSRHRYTVDLHGGRVRIQDAASGVVQGWDGNEAWTEPTDAPPDIPARFSTRTEHYWLCLPWKLADEGADLEMLMDATINGQAYHRVRVTYGASVGDTPDDWYIYYFSTETGMLEHMVFILTFFGLEPGQTEYPQYYGLWEEWKESGSLKVATRRRFGPWNGTPPEQYPYDERLVDLRIGTQPPVEEVFQRPGS
jgi:hypothetical protein